MKSGTAKWVRKNNGSIALLLPDLYGKVRELSAAEVMGRWTADQIASLRATLITVPESLVNAVR